MTDIIERLRTIEEYVNRAAITQEAADEIERLREERNAAFVMSKCECETNEACANLVKLHDEISKLRQQRDDLVAALKGLYISCPIALECNDFHHAKSDQHRYNEECKPRQEYLDAIAKAQAALAKIEGGK